MPVEELSVDAVIELNPPPLQELATGKCDCFSLISLLLLAVLKNGLAKLYQQANITVGECPDLTQRPYNLFRPGLGTDNSTKVVADVSGPGNLFPKLKKKVY